MTDPNRGPSIRMLLELLADLRLCEPRGDWGCLFVASVVDVVRDTELPPVTPGKVRESLHLPAVELGRCELFSGAVA